MTSEDYKKELLPTLPEQPGVYRFIDAQETILYVGKAKNLKNRVSSYFRDSKDMLPKTKVMVKNAHHVEFTLVDTEQDALLLEATLIKKHQPRYNVMLRDGKIYPYIVIKKERFPRVFVTRKIIKDGSTYFGPYSNGMQMHTILDLVKTLFPLRTCNLNLLPENIAKGKFKVCMEYHIKNCEGACVGFESEEAYNQKIARIKDILKGNFSSVTQALKQEMVKAAEGLNFETAQLIKSKLSAFENYQSKSTVVNPAIHNADVFAIETDEKMAYINYLKVANGAIINTYTLELLQNLDVEKPDLLSYGIMVLLEKFQSIPEEIIVPFDILLPNSEAKITVPKVGDKKKLLELSEKNIKYYALQKQRDEATYAKKMTTAERILTQVKDDLHLDALPLHIECFDNSNIQGTNPVSAMVCFKNARPSKRDYRHYNVKTVEGPDDFATMEEVVFRRYRRLLDEGAPLPQLIIIDGGKGQLASAVKSLTAVGLYKKIPVVGIAKRLEEIYFPEDPLPLMLSKKSVTLRLIQQLRDEAHRFGITHHRNRRSKTATVTELSDIKGVGEKTVEKLLKHLGSVKKVKQASLELLTEIAGAKVAKAIKDKFYEM